MQCVAKMAKCDVGVVYILWNSGGYELWILGSRKRSLIAQFVWVE